MSLNDITTERYHDLKGKGIIDSRMGIVLDEFRKFPHREFTARQITEKLSPGIEEYFQFEDKVRYYRPALSDLVKYKLIEQSGRCEENLLSGKVQTVIKYRLINIEPQMKMFN